MVSFSSLLAHGPALCVGGAIGAAAVLFLRRAPKPAMCIDHLVIRCNTADGKLLEESMEFYKLFGMEMEEDRLEGYRQQCENDAAGSDRKGIVFPCARISPEIVIDFFPKELEPLFCESSSGQVDHVCFCYEEMSTHLEVLKRLKANGIKLSTWGKPFGARGTGFSTYLHDPSGLYLELRNYEQDKWPVLQAWLEQNDFLGAHQMKAPVTAPYKECGV